MSCDNIFSAMDDLASESVFSWKLGMYLLTGLAMVTAAVILSIYEFSNVMCVGISMSIFFCAQSLIENKHSQSRFSFLRHRPILHALCDGSFTFTIYLLIWLITKIVYPKSLTH